MQVAVDGLQITYERMGKGNACRLLVLPGWNDDVTGWAAMQTRLSHTFDVVVPDLPGFGSSSALPAVWDLNDYARFAGAFARALKFKPTAVIGHSNGGAIAVRGIADGHVSADKLILLDSTGLRSEYKGRKKVVRVLAKTGRLFAMPLPRKLKKSLRHTVYKTLGADMLIQEDLQETFKRIVTDDIQASAAQLHVPTLLVYGEDDELTPIRTGRILHSLIDNSQLKTVSEAGHFVHLDQPATVEKMITDFME